MAVELIITSVRKGLDGGSGYQPVLRTKDLKPAVAERLQLRSGYSHPFPHGDRRNPVVHVHRIERVAGETLHVIARICDAGSDHTGRSNFLAHFVSMDDSEARRKPAGPAEVMRRMTFRTSWDEPAREADPPTVVGGERQPGPCQAWKAAGLDPGIAGDLAEAAMAGRELTLVSREGDDVLALFADALALVAPAKRWQVTFNTCRIEPFDGTWQAIRSDLPQARVARSSAGVIDLTTNPRGGESAYAAYARGDATSLPWQQSAKPVVSESERVAEPAGGLPPQMKRPGAEAVVALPAGDAGAELLVPPKLKRRPKIDYKDDVLVAEDPGRLAIFGRRLMWLALGMLLILPLAFGGVVLVWPDLLPAWTTASSVADSTRDAGKPAVPSVDLGEADRERREREKERVAEQKRLKEQQQAAAAAETAAQAKADEAKREQEAERQAAMAAEKQEREREAKQKRAADAFAALQKMPTIVVQDLVTGGDLGTIGVNEVDLGPFDFEALVQPGFALAIPKEVYDGSQFNAWVDEGPEKRGTWHILAASRPVDGGNARPLHLATLTARDGNLYLAEFDATTARNPLFRLLRRSVLLVKAHDPAKPDGKATVQRAIQLVRPAPGVLQWQVNLLEKRKDFSLPRITGITTGTPLPLLPLDARVAYQVRFDYPLQYQGGEPLDKPAVYAFDESKTFCALLECPAPNPSKPNEKPSVGVLVEISLNGGVLAVLPDVQGPGEETFPLEKMAEFVGKKPKAFEDWFKKEIAPLKLFVSKIRDQPVAEFMGSSAQNKSQALVAKNAPGSFRQSIEDFFAEEKLFPPPVKDGQPLDDGSDRVGRWQDACDAILAKARKAVEANDQAQLDVVKKEWNGVMVERLKAWLSYYEKGEKARLHKQQLDFKPLTGGVTVVVTEVSSPAYDQDGKRYDVILATPLKEGAKAIRPGVTSPDLD